MLDMSKTIINKNIQIESRKKKEHKQKKRRSLKEFFVSSSPCC